jgi:hypothetical protein
MKTPRKIAASLSMRCTGYAQVVLVAVARALTHDRRQ